MPEVSITGWLDPALKYFADQAGIPVYDYAAQVGGEGIATSLEVMADIFTKGWLNRLIQGGAGAIALSYSVWGKDVPTRLRKELLALGIHEGLRVVNNPLSMTADAESLKAFVEAVMRGDWNAALASVLRTPGEFGFAVPAPASSPLAGYNVPALPPPPPPSVPTTVEAPKSGKGTYIVTTSHVSLPLGTAPKGRYMITAG